MIQSTVTSILRKALERAGIEETEIEIEHPTVEDHGDFATNIALKLSKTLKQSPKEIAQKIASNIETGKIVERCEIAGPGFLNLFLAEEILWNEIKKANALEEKYGIPESKENKKISVEHTQVNPNKGPHVGHLRNAVIGDSLARLLSFLGNNVKVLYYQNDVGQQIASIVLAYKKQFIKKTDFPTLISWASKAYADIEKRMEENPELKKEKEEIQIQIAEQNTEDGMLAQKVTDEILKETLKTLTALQIEYDCIVRESDILKIKLWEKTFELLKTNNAFYEAKEEERAGCWLIKIPGAEDKIIVRSNGIPTYAGNDIANHLWKFGILDDFKYKKLDWNTQTKPLYTTASEGEVMNNFSNADAIVNIIDQTQTYPQQSVIESLRVLGYTKEAKNYFHVNYGFVYLSKKTVEQLGISVNEDAHQIKMSGRKGTVVSIETFLDRMQTILKEKFGAFETLNEVRNGAIKFELLKYNTYQDVIFDLDAALDVNGFSGPYVQYAHTRAVSVIKKANNARQKNTDVPLPQLSKEGVAVLRKLYQFEEVVMQCRKELSPHYLCLYLFELAKRFNNFYNTERILGSPQEAQYLILTEAVSIVLKTGLNLLGIQAPEKM